MLKAYYSISFHQNGKGGDWFRYSGKQYSILRQSLMLRFVKMLNFFSRPFVKCKDMYAGFLIVHTGSDVSYNATIGSHTGVAGKLGGADASGFPKSWRSSFLPRFQ